MMPKELIPEREKKLSTARNHNYSARMYTVYVGLNKTAEELGIKDYCIFMAAHQIRLWSIRTCSAATKIFSLISDAPFAQ